MILMFDFHDFAKGSRHVILAQIPFCFTFLTGTKISFSLSFLEQTQAGSLLPRINQNPPKFRDMT